MAEEIKKEESTEEKTEEVKEVKQEAPVEPKPEPKKEEKKEDEKPVEVPTKFKKLVEEIEKMSVLDLSELVKLLEKKFGVSAAAPVMAVAAGNAAGAAPAEEKSFFTVSLTGIGDKKIEVIKVVRDATGKGLKDSKDLVEAAASGAQVVKENVKKEEAEELKKKFEAAGATVELK